MNTSKTIIKVPSLVLDSIVAALSPYYPQLTSEALLSAINGHLNSEKSVKIPELEYVYEEDVEMLLKCSYWTLLRRRKKGVLRAFKDGRRICYWIKDINKYLANCRKTT